MPHERTPSNGARPRLTTAGRLLVAIAERGAPTLAALAQRLDVTDARLDECRRGVRPLELESQMRLAAFVLAEAPDHARLARARYDQAQAALRMRDGADRVHMTYPKEHFR